MQLDSDRDAAWEKYRVLWHKLMMFFQCHNCPSPPEHADEALSRIARRDDLADIRNISAFAYGVARKMSFEIYEDLKKEISVEALPGRSIPDGRNVELETLANIDRDRRLRCVCRCLEKLQKDDRTLFITFQTADSDQHKEVRKKLAEKQGISAGTLRVRVFRIRRELEACARKCVVNRLESPQ
jgi:DNA-directed RNA polymerase specialized sigma24 family protein